MKKIIKFLTHNFTLIVATSFATATLDLWTLPSGTSLGFIFAIVLLAGGLLYSMFKKQNVMKVSIILTWSKIVATLILAGAIYLDVKNGEGATAFMYALPFIVFLITGKQYLDKSKP